MDVKVEIIHLELLRIQVLDVLAFLLGARMKGDGLSFGNLYVYWHVKTFYIGYPAVAELLAF